MEHLEQHNDCIFNEQQSWFLRYQFYIEPPSRKLKMMVDSFQATCSLLISSSLSSSPISTYSLTHNNNPILVKWMPPSVSANSNLTTRGERTPACIIIYNSNCNTNIGINFQSRDGTNIPSRSFSTSQRSLSRN